MDDLELPLGKRTRFYRLFEMFPALVSYIVILLPVLLSLIDPFLGAVFVIIYIIIWFVKAMAMSVRSIQGYNTLEHAKKVKWQHRLNDLEDPDSALEQWGDTQAREWKSHVHHHNLQRMAATEGAKRPSDIYNAILVATYNESREVLEPTIRSILASQFDMKRVILTIAYEERGGKTIKETVTALKEEYGASFAEMLLVEHPDGVKDEVIGKGANITHAGRELYRLIQEKGIDPENVIVTTLDADNRPHETYFAYMTYEYLVHPEPRYASFQPMSLFLNNIWDVPAPMRVLATNNSFWNIVISQRPNMLRNFASHSQGMASLVDMDFWSTRTIVEDGHQFWRSYFRYDGHYSVVPIYVPIYQDAVMTEKYTRTLKAQFVQLRRWAYGASDIPYVAQRVLVPGKRTVPFWDGLSKFARLVDSHVSWASAPFVLLFGAFAPLFLSSESNRSIVAHQLPGIASGIQQIAMIGILVIIIVSFKLLPERPARYKWSKNIGMILQWVLAPVLGIVYGASAALYSQTRLLFGKYLDRFDVTEKAVVSDDGVATS